jgi:hypothetical protein
MLSGNVLNIELKHRLGDKSFLLFPLDLDISTIYRRDRCFFQFNWKKICHSRGTMETTVVIIWAVSGKIWVMLRLVAVPRRQWHCGQWSSQAALRTGLRWNA